MNQTVPILLPQAGNSMEEGTILAWRVKVGDEVKVGDILFELETDKATLEVEAEAAGKIGAIVVQAGETALVKTPVAYFGEPSAITQVQSMIVTPLSRSVEPIAISEEPSTPPIPPTPSHDRAETSSDLLSPSRQRVSPVARKAADELGVNLTQISQGSGPDGRVLLEDVVKASATRASNPSSVVTSMRSESRESVAPIRANAGGERVPMTKMRRAIAKNLSISKQTLPHWYLKTTLEADAVLDYYRTEKLKYPCSLNDVIVLAVSKALMEFPLFRTQIDGDDFVQFPSANIGLAVGLDQGLVVPVMKNVEARNLRGIAQESRRLIESAKLGKVEGMGEGVFTISNLGMFGVEEFVAIVNPPESGILAVGAAREEVIVANGAMRIGKKMTIVLSADHRIIDGTVGAKFMAYLKSLLENPITMGG